MTRSGASSAAVSAICANGHAARSLHGCQTLNAPYNRQPESPSTTIRRMSDFGNGSERMPMFAFTTPAGTLRSQTVIGNAAGLEAAGALIVGRSGTVAGPTRTFIGRAAPSIVIEGHAASDVIARAIAIPSGPSSIHAEETAASTASARGDGEPQAVTSSATTIASNSATTASQRLR